MARIRTIKPEFFRHEELFEAEVSSGLPLRLAFAGLFTVADRDGRFKWQPRVLKLDVMPFDEVNFTAVLDALAAHGFIVKYRVGDDTFGHIPSWAKHQHINQREAESAIPSPDEADARTCGNMPAHGEGKGRELEGKGKEHEAPSQASGAAIEKLILQPEAGAPPERQRYSDDFEAVWAEYRPIASPNATKADAMRAFARLSKPDREACWAGVVRYVQWLLEQRRKRGDFPAKHLATFINRRGWETFMDEAMA